MLCSRAINSPLAAKCRKLAQVRANSGRSPGTSICPPESTPRTKAEVALKPAGVRHLTGIKLSFTRASLYLPGTGNFPHGCRRAAITRRELQ